MQVSHTSIALFVGMYMYNYAFVGGAPEAYGWCFVCVCVCMYVFHTYFSAIDTK